MQKAALAFLRVSNAALVRLRMVFLARLLFHFEVEQNLNRRPYVLYDRKTVDACQVLALRSQLVIVQRLQLAVRPGLLLRLNVP